MASISSAGPTQPPSFSGQLRPFDGPPGVNYDERFPASGHFSFFHHSLPTALLDMKIAVIGTGYVGLVTGTCFADSGNDVTCVDIDRAKIERLKAGDIPIYEPGLEEMVRENQDAERLHFTTDLAAAVSAAEVVYLAVGTPQGDDGAADMRAMWSVVDSIAKHLRADAVVV